VVAQRDAVAHHLQEKMHIHVASMAKNGTALVTMAHVSGSG
jgi:hypothetical protein